MIFFLKFNYIYLRILVWLLIPANLRVRNARYKMLDARRQRAFSSRAFSYGRQRTLPIVAGHSKEQSEGHSARVLGEYNAVTVLRDTATSRDVMALVEVTRPRLSVDFIKFHVTSKCHVSELFHVPQKQKEL